MSPKSSGLASRARTRRRCGAACRLRRAHARGRERRRGERDAELRELRLGPGHEVDHARVTRPFAGVDDVEHARVAARRVGAEARVGRGRPHVGPRAVERARAPSAVPSSAVASGVGFTAASASDAAHDLVRGRAHGRRPRVHEVGRRARVLVELAALHAEVVDVADAVRRLGRAEALDRGEEAVDGRRVVDRGSRAQGAPSGRAGRRARTRPRRRATRARAGAWQTSSLARFLVLRGFAGRDRPVGPMADAPETAMSGFLHHGNDWTRVWCELTGEGALAIFASSEHERPLFVLEGVDRAAVIPEPRAASEAGRRSAAIFRVDMDGGAHREYFEAAARAEARSWVKAIARARRARAPRGRAARTRAPPRARARAPPAPSPAASARARADAPRPRPRTRRARTTTRRRRRCRSSRASAR